MHPKKKKKKPKTKSKKLNFFKTIPNAHGVSLSPKERIAPKMRYYNLSLGLWNWPLKWDIVTYHRKSDEASIKCISTRFLTNPLQFWLACSRLASCIGLVYVMYNFLKPHFSDAIHINLLAYVIYFFLSIIAILPTFNE